MTEMESVIKRVEKLEEENHLLKSKLDAHNYGQIFSKIMLAGRLELLEHLIYNFFCYVLIESEEWTKKEFIKFFTDIRSNWVEAFSVSGINAGKELGDVYPDNEIEQIVSEVISSVDAKKGMMGQFMSGDAYNFYGDKDD